MDNSQLIDIIIPAFKAQDFIYKTLSSIAMQTVAHRCKVTIVNDADGFGYSSIVDYFNKILDIKEITLETNSGPGVARQFGIDNTNCPYIMFMDADDTFMNAYSLESIIQSVEKNKEPSILIFSFYESFKNDKIVFEKRNENMVWVFAKLYNRNFLEKNNIRFNKSRANEDVYFNTLIELSLSSVEETPIFIDLPVYMWHYNENSITRKNNHEFSYNESLMAYAQNAIAVFSEAKRRKNIKKQHLNRKALEFMTILYYHYLIICEENPKIKEENFKLCVEFYDKICSTLEYIYNPITIKKYAIEDLRLRRDNIKDIIPELTYKQFIDKIKEELKNQEVINEES